MAFLATTGVEAAASSILKDISPAKGNDKKDNSLEGLRGVAAFSVWCHHFLLAFFPLGFSLLFPGLQASPAADGAMEHFLRTPFLSVLWAGQFPVAIFFVLSGYVLSQSYYNSKSNETLLQRCLRRYIRLIIPISGSVLIAFALMKTGAMHNTEAAALSQSDWLGGLFGFTATIGGALRAIVYRVLLYGDAAFNSALWTMRVEFFGSLLIYIFCALSPKDGLMKAMHFAIATGCILIMSGGDAVYYLSFLAGGALCFIAPPRAPWHWLLFVIGLALGGYQYDTYFSWMKAPLGYDSKVFYNAAGAFALLWGLRSGMLDFALASRIGRMLGRLSFSLYLTHFFVLTAFSSWFYVRFLNCGPNWVITGANFLLSTALLFAVATLFERWMDRQGIVWSKRLCDVPQKQGPKMSSPMPMVSPERIARNTAR